MRSQKILNKATLVFPIRQDERVLLGLKPTTSDETSEHKIGAGFWNGYGGGVPAGVSVRSQAVRETWQESGLFVCESDLEKVAIAIFHNQMPDGYSYFACKVHVFLVAKWRGEPKSTDEMICPVWFPIGQIGRTRDFMMPADRFWVPAALAGKKIHVYGFYGPYQRTLLRRVVVEEVQELEDD